LRLLRITKKIRAAERRLREARMVAHAIKSPYHPILVHLIPIRRCNLSCSYCNEYDSFSRPISKDVLFKRINLIADLGSANIHLSGGEPLLHPNIVEIIQQIRARGVFAGLLTNGYLLTTGLIEELNSAGLDYLQISVDNVQPDEISKKSLKVLDQKLQMLAKHADFEVSINSVLGNSTENPQDAVAIARRAAELGLKTTVGILHDQFGQLQELSDEHQRAYKEAVKLADKSFVSVSYYNQFQANLVHGKPNQWQCRAGSRYLYVCEEGLVHYCSQQRGRPGIPLEEYTTAHLQRENQTVKACAPYCTISCVHRIAMLDILREQPLAFLDRTFPQEQGITMPVPVRLLKWIFLTPDPGPPVRILRKAIAAGLLKSR
jgi:MoaA/NifB/PqqE/SkfB family radical SAM enzyme